MAYSYARLFIDQEMYDGAKYCLEIIYDLTEAEDIKKMLDGMKEN